ncbi:hypothetical protein BS50DRAFT_640916 [Corynespora cassiicola Philippines]|uniref:Uncharacterized protein n=1 Tax=Corynespora cassiicola Philippines TaxID=1448308 RepID=A0A2T2N2H2_CORCC|nr:hypothetical protein BS50DRAFT_640916 [Corynespora cassiicola Philippines]
MVAKASIIAASVFATVGLALPLGSNSASSLTADTITSISPSTASCAGADFPDECHDAATAAPAITKSFEKYGVQSKGEQAALIAIMLFESGDFKYNKNHFPGVPGQGTKNMQSPAFNQMYAKSLFPEKAAQAQSPEAVLDLVSGPDETFGSAAWFLTSQCTPAVRDGLASGTIDGWHTYLTTCVGTTAAAERDVSWNAAIAAL